MKLPLFYLFIIIFLFTSELFAQPWMSLIPKEKADNPGFYEQQKAFNEYWKDKEVTRSKGWKQFKRWEAFMEPRVFPDGNFDNTALFREFNKLNTRTTKGINSSNWEQLGPVDVPINQLSYPSKGIGRLNCVAFHPSNSNIIWVGAPAGGIWVSNDGGSSWSTQSDLFTNLGISDIEFNPLDPDVIYVATGDGDGSNTYSYGILKTEDAGASWDAVFPLSITSGNTIRRILVNTSDPDIVLAATSAGIYVSVNAGITWYNKQSGNFKDMEFNPNSPNVVYASSYDYYGDAGVYKSTDGGLSWTQLTNGLPLSGVGRIELAVTEANSSMVYALCANTDNGFYGLYRSYNSGGSWSLASSSPNILGHAEDGSEAGGQAYYDLALEVSSTNENILYSGGVNIWKSTNAGSSWSLNAHWYGGGGAEFVHADQHFFAIHPISGDLYSCNDGGLHITSDGGNNWIDLSDGMEITQFYRIACAETSSSIIMGGTQDNGSIKYTGGNWYKILGGDGMECMIDYNNSNVLYGTFYYGSIQRSSNGGNSFDDITPYDAGDGAWVTPFVMDPENSNTIYGGFKEVYKTTNGGSSWNAISSNLTNGELLHSLAVAPSSSSVIYAATYDKIWKTSDGGLNWSEISDGLPSVSISYIAVDDNDPQKLWLSFSGYLSNRKLYYSEDGGVNWINWSNGIPNIPANCVVHEYGSNDAVYVGTDLGVFYRSADMSEFMDYNEGLPNVIVNDLEIHYGSGKLRAGTFGRGLWQCDLYVIPQAPEADFQANLTQIYEGDNVEFTDQSTNSPTEWQWSFSGGTPNSSTDQNPNVTYSSPGIYPVSLTASNDGGSSTITKEDYIEVLINPQQLNADFEANTTTIQEGETVNFTDLSSGDPTSFTWTFAGGDPNIVTDDQHPQVAYNIAGSYDVQLEVSDGTNSSTELKTSYIVVEPYVLNADFEASAVSVVAGGFIDFTDLSVGNVAGWYWSFNGGTPSSSTSQNPSGIVFNTPGIYTISLNITDGTSSDIETKTGYITVLNDPNELVANFSANQTTIYQGESVTFSDLSNGNPVGWYWSFQGGTPVSSYNQDPGEVVYNQLGTFNVVLDVTDGSDQDTELKNDYITVIPDPAALYADFSANQTEITTGDPVDFSDLSNGAPIGWYWTFNGGSPSYSTEQNPQHIVYNTAGSYEVQLNITDGISTDNEIKNNYILVSDPVTSLNADFSYSFSQITEGDSIDFIDQSTGTITDWYWSFEGGTPGNASNQNPMAIVYNNPGTYSVSLQVSDGNNFDTETKVGIIQVDSASSVQSIEFRTPVVYPNPASHVIHIENIIAAETDVCLYSLYGQKVDVEIVSDGVGSKWVNVEKLNNSCYLLEIKTRDKIFTRPVILIP